MIGNPEVLQALNGLLIDELSAVHQYLAHEANLRDVGYTAFADIIKKRGDSEREHADELLARIYMLGGRPDMTTVRNVNVGETAVSILENDLRAEITAIESYNKAIEIACSVGDFTTRALLEHIAGEENDHANEIEGLITQANQMSLENFLSTMTGR